jgi:hypothetical protein
MECYNSLGAHERLAAAATCCCPCDVLRLQRCGVRCVAATARWDVLVMLQLMRCAGSTAAGLGGTFFLDYSSLWNGYV